MRDEHERALVLLEELLQPVDSGKVKVVGRLVEKKQVGMRGEDAAQLSAHPPAAGERGERLRELFHGEAESSERHLHARLEVVPAEMLERGLHLPVLLQHALVAGVQLLLQLAHPRVKLVESRHAAQRILEQRLVWRVGLRILPRGAYARTLLDHELAVVGGHLSEDDLEESGLAGAVRPHHAHALALVHAEADVRENVLQPVMYRYVLEV